MDNVSLDASDTLEVLLIDGSGLIITLSPNAAKYLGRPQHELQGRSLSAVFRNGIDPVFTWLDALANSGSPPPPLLLNLEHPQPELASIHVEAVLYAIEVGIRAKGETVAGLAIRPRTGTVVESELLSAQRQILELVAQRSSLPQSLAAVAKFSEKVLPSEVFCLLTPISESGVCGDGLCPTLPVDIQSLLRLHASTIDGAPGLISLQSEKIILATDLDQDPRWSNYAKRLRTHGLVAVWCFPIHDSRLNRVRALLEFHLPVRRGPNRSELKVVEELSELVRLAIDLHQLQSDLDASESSLRSTVQTIPLLLWQTNAQGRFTECQGKGLDSLGLRMGEVLGQLVGDIFSSDSRAKIYVEKALAGENVSGEFSVGMTQFIQSAGPLRNEAGTIVGARGVALDVTAQRLAEDSAQEKDDLLKTVIDTALDAVVSIDVHGKIIVWNKQAELMFGWTHAEVSGKRLDETIIPPAFVKAHREGMRRYHAEGVGRILGKRIEITAINRQGIIFPVELTVSPHVGKNASGFSAFIRDISDRIRSDNEKVALEASLSSAESMKSLGLLASGFAHELDSVLRVIRAHALLTNISTGLPIKAVESLEVIQMKVAQAMSMSRNLIVLGEGGEGGSAAQAIVVSDAVREAVRLLTPNLPRTISVVVDDLTDGRESAAIDLSRMQQAILNLLMRATESLASNGLITLRITQSMGGVEPLVRVECIDQGETLSADQQLHAFEALAADGSLRGRTAMGLAQVQRFALSAGGNATVSSTAEGTHFCFTIPTIPHNLNQERLPIVLAKNHPLLRPMLVEALNAKGHRVMTVENNVELLATVKRAGTRCIIILDQDSIAGSLKQVLADIQSELNVLPPVILLGNSDVKDIDVNILAARLSKPFLLESLLDEIAKVTLSYS